MTATAPPIGICTATAVPDFSLPNPLAAAGVSVVVASVAVAVVVAVLEAVAAAAEAALIADLAEAMDALLRLSFVLVPHSSMFAFHRLRSSPSAHDQHRHK